jgi:hypothetical protein
MRTLLITAFITVLAANAHAQGLGYAVAGPAGAVGFVNVSRITFHAAGGGEVFLGKYVSAGGEAGFFDRLITVSANGTLHAAGEDRIVPFLTAGYTRLGVSDGEGGADAWNIGAGANAWFSRHAGLRFELRDHIRPDDRGTTHYWSFRAGIAFR